MKGKKIFWGLFFIIASGLIIVNQLNIFTDVNLISLLFTILLVAILVKSLFARSFVGTFFPLAFLAIIYAEPLEITNLTPWPVLTAALFCSIGFTIIFGGNHYKHDVREFTEETIEFDQDNVVDVNVSFGASTKYVNVVDLEKVNISCNFGAAKVYLDKAVLKKSKAVIDVNVSFAGVEIYIPKNCRIENRADVTLGAIEEKNNNNSVTDCEIIITGKCSFAGVEIIYI